MHKTYDVRHHHSEQNLNVRLTKGLSGLLVVRLNWWTSLNLELQRMSLYPSLDLRMQSMLAVLCRLCEHSMALTSTHPHGQARCPLPPGWFGRVYVPFCPPPLLYHYCSLHLQFLIACSMQKQFYILQAIKNCRLVKSGCDIKLETFSPDSLCSLGSPAHTLLLRPFFIEIVAIPLNLSLNSLYYLNLLY